MSNIQNNNTCVEQWYYNVDYPLNSDGCNINGVLNHVDGNIDMILYKVEGPRSNFAGISSISLTGNQKKHINRTKPTAKQISSNIDIDVVNNISCFFFTGVTRSGHFIEAFSAREPV